jgi:hypothetical protein
MFTNEMQMTDVFIGGLHSQLHIEQSKDSTLIFRKFFAAKETIKCFKV